MIFEGNATYHQADRGHKRQARECNTKLRIMTAGIGESDEAERQRPATTIESKWFGWFQYFSCELAACGLAAARRETEAINDQGQQKEAGQFKPLCHADELPCGA